MDDKVMAALPPSLRSLGRPLLGGVVTLAESGLVAGGIPRPAVLLLLGHMRSGSTLVLHLLMTNREVSAAGERGVPYASSADLARLAMVVRIKHRSPLRVLRYVTDQVNHSHLTPNPQLLQDRRVYSLFLLRRPKPTITSIVQLYRTYHPQPWSVQRAVDYYVERLQDLRSLAGRLRDAAPAALIEYETLTALPDETLRALQSFLELRHGFSQCYETYAFTGTHGDPGPRIAAGKILPATETADVQVHIDAPELERADRAYDQCREALARFKLLPLSVASA
jgi:hypothetical protein